MNTKIIIAATVAALSLATTAFAGEAYSTADVGNQQYPAPVAGLSFNSVPTLPENGQNGAVQTANSLPLGFENGTVAFTQAQSVNQWLAQAADHRFARAQLNAARHG